MHFLGLGKSNVVIEVIFLSNNLVMLFVSCTFVAEN